MSSIFDVISRLTAGDAITQSSYVDLSRYWLGELENADYFNLCGVSSGYSAETNTLCLKVKFRQFMSMFHPDKLNGTNGAGCPAHLRNLIDILVKTVSGAYSTLTKESELIKYKISESRKAANGKSSEFVPSDLPTIQGFHFSWDDFLKLTNEAEMDKFIDNVNTTNSAILTQLVKTKVGAAIDIFHYCTLYGYHKQAKCLLKKFPFFKSLGFDAHYQERCNMNRMCAVQNTAQFYRNVTLVLAQFNQDEMAQFFSILKDVKKKNIWRSDILWDGVQALLPLDKRLFDLYLKNNDESFAGMKPLLRNVERFIEYGLVDAVRVILTHFSYPQDDSANSASVQSDLSHALVNCEPSKLKEMLAVLYNAHFRFNHEAVRAIQCRFLHSDVEPVAQNIAILMQYGFLFDLKTLREIRARERYYAEPAFRKALNDYHKCLSAYALCMRIFEGHESILNLIKSEFVARMTAQRMADGVDNDEFFVSLFGDTLGKVLANYPMHNEQVSNLSLLIMGIFGKLSKEHCSPISYMQANEYLKANKGDHYIFALYEFAYNGVQPVLYMNNDNRSIYMLELSNFDICTFPETHFQRFAKRLTTEQIAPDLIQHEAPIEPAVTPIHLASLCRAEESVEKVASSDESKAAIAAIKANYFANANLDNPYTLLHKAILEGAPIPANFAARANATTLMCALLANNRQLVAKLLELQMPILDETIKIVCLLDDEALLNQFVNIAEAHGVSEDVRTQNMKRISQTMQSMQQFGLAGKRIRLMTDDRRMDAECFNRALDSVLNQQALRV